MKLRNKKTGKIERACPIYVQNCGEFNSLAELNEEWEDALEEPKVIYYVSWDGHILNSADVTGWQDSKQIGNYFETKEEAERAVEKLKAWKRLKDKGFEFKGVNEDDGSIKTGLSKGVKICESVEFYEDMTLLFGGEE